jgi:NADH-quinone oxidoreductase subunit G
VLLESNALPDVRVLAGIAEELGRPLGFRTPEGAGAELEELGVWDGAPAPLAEAPRAAGPAASAEDAGLRLATWKPMIGDGAMQDGDPAYHASGPVPVALVGPARLAALGLSGGDRVRLATTYGAVELPVGEADLHDDVVWAPTGSGGIDLTRDLGAGPGDLVTLTPAPRSPR